MAKNKKRKAKSPTIDEDDGAPTSSFEKKEHEHKLRRNSPKEKNIEDHRSDSDDDSSSSDDSLVLEGALIRNPDFRDSGSDSDDNGRDDNASDISSEEEDQPTPKTNATITKSKESKKSNNSDNSEKHKSQKHKGDECYKPETIQVEFLFCDMNDRFFHGMKTLLHRHSIHAPHSSQLSDLIIANEMVGTVMSSDIDPSAAAVSAVPVEEKKSSPKKSNAAAASSLPPPRDEANVFGFASVVNITVNHSSPAIQGLKSTCLKYCPSQHKEEMEILLSGKTKRPAGFFFQERMVNVPLEIVEVLHQQLVLDMDYAVEHADDEAERKTLDFGAFVRLAPCYPGNGGSVIYKYFDDEVFATNAEIVFKVPKMNEDDEDGMCCNVIVLTKTGHRGAMKELKKMIHGN